MYVHVQVGVSFHMHIWLAGWLAGCLHVRMGMRLSAGLSICPCMDDAFSFSTVLGLYKRFSNPFNT